MTPGPDQSTRAYMAGQLEGIAWAVDSGNYDPQKLTRELQRIAGHIYPEARDHEPEPGYLSQLGGLPRA